MMGRERLFYTLAWTCCGLEFFSECGTRMPAAVSILVEALPQDAEPCTGRCRQTTQRHRKILR